MLRSKLREQSGMNSKQINIKDSVLQFIVVLKVVILCFKSQRITVKSKEMKKYLIQNASKYCSNYSAIILLYNDKQRSRLDKFV